MSAVENAHIEAALFPRRRGVGETRRFSQFPTAPTCWRCETKKQLPVSRTPRFRGNSLVAWLLTSLVLWLAPIPVSSQKLSGRWSGRIVYDSVTIGFPLEFTGSGPRLAASFFNGEDRITSTGVQWLGDSLIVSFAHLATELRAVVADGMLRGLYGNPKRGSYRPVEARPQSASKSTGGEAPNIDGFWYLPYESNKGEHALMFVVKQTGARATATILRIDGDAGAHVGEYADGRFLLEHFDGARPSQLEVFPATDSILVIQRGAR